MRSHGSAAYAVDGSGATALVGRRCAPGPIGCSGGASAPPRTRRLEARGSEPARPGEPQRTGTSNGRIMNVAVMGTGHIGLVTCVALSSLGHEVVGTDVDGEKISLLTRGV